MEFEEAEAMLRRALEGSERVSGVDHPETINTRGNLGVLLMKRGDESGEEMVRDVLSSLLSPPHSLTETHRWIKKFNQANQAFDGSEMTNTAGSGCFWDITKHLMAADHHRSSIRR